MTATDGPPTTGIVVKAEGLTKRFGARLALDAVGLDVQAGEVHGLLGPNGAGKTTLLSILLGLVAHDSGVVELFGKTRAAGHRHDLTGVAGCVEEPFFYPYLSARATLEILAALDRPGHPADVAEVLERVGLLPRAGDRVGAFSTGMRQRLAIATALLRRPRLMVLDEPTSGLDPTGGLEIAGLIGELSAEGVTVLLSSHQIAEVEQACHAFTILCDGHVSWQGTADEMRRVAPASSYSMRTSDDARALELARATEGVSVERVSGESLVVHATDETLAAYVVELGRGGVAVLRLELRAGPLATLFFSLVGG